MCEVEDCHYTAKGKGCCRIRIKFSHFCGKECKQSGTHIGIRHSGQIGPECPHRREGVAVICGTGSNIDHCHVSNKGNVPCNMTGNSSQYNDDGGYPLRTDFFKLEQIKNGDNPWKHSQPGTVTAPLQRFHLVQHDAVYPGQCCIYNASDRLDKGHKCQRKLCDICQEICVVVSLDTGHPVKSQISDAIKCFQGFTNWFFLFCHKELSPRLYI